MNTIKPTAYLIGAPKAGSSALSAFLDEHPEISLSSVKETNFHCEDFNISKPHNETEYLSLFEMNTQTKVLLDGSILNLYSQKAAQAIYDYCPDAKIIVILRDPVKATYAWHSQMVFTANEPIQDFSKALAAETHRKNGELIPPAGTTHDCPQFLFYSEVMRYGQQLKKYFDLFPKEQILVLFQEDLIASPQTTYDKILAFLSVTPFTPNFRPINTNKSRRFRRLYSLLKIFLAAPAKRLLPMKMRLKLINILEFFTASNSTRSKLDKEINKALRDSFSSDIAQLETLLGVNLSHWKSVEE